MLKPQGIVFTHIYIYIYKNTVCILYVYIYICYEQYTRPVWLYLPRSRCLNFCAGHGITLKKLHCFVRNPLFPPLQNIPLLWVFHGWIPSWAVPRPATNVDILKNGKPNKQSPKSTFLWVVYDWGLPQADRLLLSPWVSWKPSRSLSRSWSHDMFQL